MAENKKGFILYADQKELFDQLPNDKAGELIKHIFSYVNDENPISEDLLINVSFTPIKQQLKRDLDKWQDKQGKNSEAGKKSAGKKAWNKWVSENKDINNIDLDSHIFEKGRCIKYMNENHGTHLYYYYKEAIEFHDLNITRLKSVATKSTHVESVEKKSTKSTVTVNDTVTVNVNVNGNVIKERKADFRKSLLPFLDQYGSDLLNDFFSYWSEHGEKDRKMRFEKEKSFGIPRRLSTWRKRQEQFNNKNENGNQKSRRQKFIDTYKG